MSSYHVNINEYHVLSVNKQSKFYFFHEYKTQPVLFYFRQSLLHVLMPSLEIHKETPDRQRNRIFL